MFISLLEKVPFFQKRGFFNVESKTFIFQNSITQMFFNYLRNISWKFEVPSLKNLGADIFSKFRENWR